MTYDPQRPQSGIPREPDQGSRGGVATEPQYQRQDYAAGGRPPAAKRQRTFIAAGLAGLVLLGGLIAGLAASYNGGPSTTLVQAVHGTGVNVSPTFKAPSGTMTARWNYSCTGTAGSHAFVAGLVGAAAGAGNLKIAVTSGGVKSGVTTLHPKAGQLYRLGGDSGCPYRVLLYSK